MGTKDNDIADVVARFKDLSKADLDRLVSISDGDPARLLRYAKRRALGTPFEYITGTANISGLEIYVDRRVYVPDPETEQVLNLGLKALPQQGVLLDVGTGSGWMALLAKLRRPDAVVYGCDIDQSALEVARMNAERYMMKIRFFESMYVEDVPLKKVDVIVSDMPYGYPDFILDTVSHAEFSHMPPHAIQHPGGVLTAYVEQIESIQRKGWHPLCFFETGTVPENIVAENFQHVKFEYIQLNNYSVTRVEP